MSLKLSGSRDSQSLIQSNRYSPNETEKHDASVIHPCVTIGLFVNVMHDKTESTISPEDLGKAWYRLSEALDHNINHQPEEIQAWRIWI